MSDHKAFCDWLIRNRETLSPEAWRTGDIVARWIHVIEGGALTPEGRKAASDAFKVFWEALGKCRAAQP